MASIVNSSPDAKVEVNDNDLSKSDIVTKYRTAAGIADAALQKVISEVKTGMCNLCPIVVKRHRCICQGTLHACR